ncbi:MAG: polysaccharide pyruvyl transferase CsaB [Clostridia bacterium]|nr:polysaccharide pyruvyl transferase CsaB [Clostridia bacterium]
MTGKRILITAMALDIGGAETHVVELAKKLAAYGNKVLVASNGGIFVKEIEAAGVLHIKVPLHTKSPGSLIMSYRMLRKIIIQDSIDIVHAHARIPAFLCSILCKKLNVPFVTTVHAEFRTSIFFRAFTRWGSHTLSVSKDINEYLIKNYNYDPARAGLTVNGINEEVFYPREPESAILGEYNIKKDDFILTTICRLDKGSSRTVFLLMDIAQELSEKIENLRIFIVGGGSLYDRFHEKALAINKRSGRGLITMTGPRSDVEKILSVTDIFTGISRAALEAMAMRIPVVLCGDFGYLGIMNEKNREKAIETNMTCRGTAEPEAGKLKADILLLYASAQTREGNADLNYETVRKYYTVSRMTDDAVMLYKRALNGMTSPPGYYHAVISGYYGFENSGDEAMLSSIIKDLKKAKNDIRLLVLSKRPSETTAGHGVASIGRANPFSISRAFGKTGMLISGGGNLIQDLTSFQSMLYYTGLMNYAKYRGLKVMMYANGIGPLKRKTSVAIAAKVLDKADIITVREKNSYDMLGEIGVSKPVISITADPVMSFENPQSDRVREALEKHGIPGDERTVVISVRPWKGLESAFASVFAEIADYMSMKYGLLPVFISMNIKKDTRVSEDIIQRMKSRALLVKDEANAMNLISIISKAEILVGMRLHSLIYASLTGTPGIGIVYDPKVRYFIEMMEQVDGGLVENLKFEDISGTIDHIMSNRDEYEKRCRENMVRLRARSAENARIAIDLLERDSVVRKWIGKP